MVKIEIELGIFFLRCYNLLLYGDHKYAKIKYFVSSLIGQVWDRERETGVGERIQVWERERQRQGWERDIETGVCEREDTDEREGGGRDRSERKGERQGWERER